MTQHGQEGLLLLTGSLGVAKQIHLGACPRGATAVLAWPSNTCALSQNCGPARGMPILGIPQEWVSLVRSPFCVAAISGDGRLLA